MASRHTAHAPRIFVGIDAGTHFPGRRPVRVRDGGAFAVFDWQSCLGIVAGVTAIRTAIEKARTAGVGCAAVFNGNHFGTAGFYSRLATEEQMIGVAMCNGAPGVCPPSGGRAVIGPNPVAIGAPTRSKPIVLDMSIAAIVRGRVLEHQRTGTPLPEGVALDAAGRPTTDPTAALVGAFLPFGGSQAYKAFGLGVMIDILSGPLCGAAYAERVRGSADTTEDCNKGDFFLAIDVRQFRDYEGYLDDVEDLARIIRDSGEDVYLPGEIEEERANQAQGMVELDDDMAEQLAAIGERLSVTPPDVLVRED